MAGTKSVNRTARTLLLALASLLAVGAIGSLFMGARAANQAKTAAVDQAKAIVQNSLPFALAPGDVTSPASDARAELITSHLTPVVLDPTPYDTITIWSTDGTIVYSTDRTLIGQRPEEFRTPVRDAITHGTVTSAMQDGSFSVLLPLRLRSDGPPSAAVELARPADPIAAASQPWRFNAILMTIAFFIVGGVVYRLMRLTGAQSTFLPASARVAPAAVLPRIEAPSPGLREEADARKKAEERATAAEERLNLIQDQYRKTLEELQITQRIAHDRPQPSAPDPEAEARMLKSEGQIRLLEGQLKAMSTERDKLARHIAEQAKSKVTEPDVVHRTRQVEQEAIGLRAELEGAQTELSVTRRELDALKAQAARAIEMQEDLDAIHVEALHAREGMESSNTELAHTKAELEDVRNEMRVLRNEEQKAAVLGEELRSSRAELESLKASHRAELIEREADLEDRVRRTREDFQTQLEEQRTQAARQLAELEATLTKAVSEREAALTADASSRTASIEREAAEREATLRREAAEREAELQHRLAEREATLQQEMAEQLSALEQRLLQREEELSSRAAAAEQKAGAAMGDLETTKAELARSRADLQAAHDEIEAAVYDGSSRNEQVSKANDELLRSRTEIETLQQELAESSRQREHAEAQRAEVARERDEAQRELAIASAEVQAELARGVDLSGRVERAEQEVRSLREHGARASGELERANAEQDRLTRALNDAETRHAAELAAVEARLRPDTEAEEVLRASQERLASQTERLIEVEERAHAAERQLADTIVHMDEVEAELRHLQMEKALHDLQAERPITAEPAVAEVVVAEPLEDRRASTPFTKELALDAKKSLSHILGLTQIMKYKKDSKDQAQLIKQLTAVARRLDHTVADLAEADTLAHGAVQLTIKRTDLEALVKRVVDESGVGEDHDVRIDSQPLVVGVDSLRVEQVLAGMLRNSGDRTPTGKAITVRLANHEGGALLSVEDSEPSSDASLSPVVQRFVEMQGGWTRVESRDGGGSAFRAFLPDGGPTATAPAAAEDTAADTGQDGAARDTLQIVVAGPGENGATEWAGPEEQLFVQELHQLHAED